MPTWDKSRNISDFHILQLSKMAGALAHEGREALDALGDTDYYLWFIESWGNETDMERAEIEEEEE